MREIRTSGSEGGAGRKPRSYLYLEAPRLCGSKFNPFPWRSAENLDVVWVEEKK